MTLKSRAILMAVLMVGVAPRVQAQSNGGHYGTWQNPALSAGRGALRDGPQNTVKSLLHDLNVLINKAERDRAADQLFLQDLKDLSARYENPWQRRVFFDDFGDGDYIRNPQWSVKSGEYFIEKGYGLRSKITSSKGSSQQTAPSKRVSKEQMLLSVFGAVLGAKTGAVTQAPQASPSPVVKPAEIVTRVRIPNAFLITAELSSWSTQGRFDVGVEQGLRGAGYRVVYYPAAQGRQAQLDLVKVTSRGESVIDTVAVAALEDQRIHTLTWVRQNTGDMTISVDNAKALAVRDRSFKDAFSALVFTTAKADVIVKSVTVMGAR